MKRLQFVVVALVTLLAGLAVAQDKPASNMEILREKIKADKKLLVAANMGLTEAEAKGFWPVYDAYQADLGKINGRVGKVIQSYAEAYRANTLTNEKAKSLMDEVIKVEQAEVNPKKAYIPKLVAVLPATKMARYLQIENKIRAVIKYEMANEIPLAP
jgi:hypothetical protein